MKKKLALLLALVMVCATMLTACGSSKSKIVGTWVLKSASVGGVEASAEAMKDTVGDMSMIFDDKKVEFLTNGESQGKGDWKEDGDKITITIDGDSQEATLTDGNLVMDLMGTKITFEKK